MIASSSWLGAFIPSLSRRRRLSLSQSPRFVGKPETSPRSALRYLVWCRVVEFQDWSVPRHTTDDDDNDLDGDDSSDSDGNHNQHHPGLDNRSRCTSWGPKMMRLVGAGDDAPSLGNGRGTTFHQRSSVVIGSLLCPIPKSKRPRAAASRTGSCAAAEFRGKVVAATEDKSKSCQKVACEDPSSLHRWLEIGYLGRSLTPCYVR